MLMIYLNINESKKLLLMLTFKKYLRKNELNFNYNDCSLYFAALIP